MIDCTKTENYFAEKRRMVKADKTGSCRIECEKCPLGSRNNGTNCKICCTELERCYSEKAIAIMQKWSNAHPQKTYLTELMEQYPNVLLDDNDTPEGICPHQLGLKSSIADCKKGYDCVACWNQPLPDKERDID